jgi:hypothetical protein
LHELALDVDDLVRPLEHVNRMRIVRALSAIARDTACRIHPAYVESLKPLR